MSRQVLTISKDYDMLYLRKTDNTLGQAMLEEYKMLWKH